MLQTKFRNKEQYFEWRTYWKRQYESSTKAIRHYKNEIKENKHPAICRMLLRREQTIARNLMIARQAVESAHRVRKACETSIEVFLGDCKVEMILPDDIIYQIKEDQQ